MRTGRRGPAWGLLGLWTAAALWSEQPAGDRELAEFTAVRIAGFTGLLSPAFQADAELQGRALWRLEEQLGAAVSALPPAQRERLRSVRIWVDPGPQAQEGATFAPTAWYISRRAAGIPGFPYRNQAGSIVVSNLTAFIRDHGRYNVMLHELAHAYDDRELGFSHPGVLAAFESARQSQRYASIHNDAGTMAAESYANARAAEYFAELTVAYFASRPTTPHNRAELRTFDPQGYRAIRSAWGLD